MGDKWNHGGRPYPPASPNGCAKRTALTLLALVVATAALAARLAR